jgi:squalene-hopene/tetraprenyl-beta-curcumene cyclase
VSGDDPAFQRALEFLKRTQMIEKAPDGTVINPMPYAKGSRQGGFIYAVSENKDKIGSGQSMAGEIEETMDDGQKVSRLRAYGSMTYAGFKSLIYAQLPANDPRVVAAYDWIRRNYTLSENPGMGTDGMYYYFVTFARGLTASAALAAGPTSERVIVTLKDGKPEERNWANDLIDRLGELQNEDGSFKSVDDRWMENNPELITAYALIALQHARGLK